MKPLPSHKRRLPLRLAAAAASILFAQTAQAADFWAEFQQRPEDFVGSLACASASCHGRAEPLMGSTGPQLQEYHRWRNADPHALAGMRIQQPQFQEVLKRAGNRPAGAADPAMYGRCARCHDPFLAERADDTSDPLTFTLSHEERERGIGCESCHGAARRWLTRHYERDVSREELARLGMIYTKSLVVRARLCAQCHVGSAENDVNHDLVAAGHPPLRFELASHQALIVSKHWDDRPRRRAQPDYEVQLWAAGRIAAADAALAVLQGRARRALAADEPAKVAKATEETRMKTDGSRAVWPELAEYDCFACHQPLQADTDGVRVGRVASRRASVPPWQRWHVALVPAAEPFDEAIGGLRQAMEQSWLAPPGKAHEQAAAARRVLREATQFSADGAILAKDGKPLDSQVLLWLERPAELSWDRLCHELAALAAVERAQRDRLLVEQASSLALLSDFGPRSDLSQRGRSFYPDGQDRWFYERSRPVVAALRFVNDNYEWPAVLGGLQATKAPPARGMSLEEAAAQLREIRTSLRRHDPGTPY